MPSVFLICLATCWSGRVHSTRKATVAASKSVRFLSVNTPIAGVRGTIIRGTCVPPTGTRPSGFVLPRANPFFFFQRPLCGLRGCQPPALPEAEAYLAIPPRKKTLNRLTLPPRPLVSYWTRKIRAPPLAINDLEPPNYSSYALNSVNLKIPYRNQEPPSTMWVCPVTKILASEAR